jgi:hypothetical protein
MFLDVSLQAAWGVQEHTKVFAGKITKNLSKKTGARFISLAF